MSKPTPVTHEEKIIQYQNHIKDLEALLEQTTQQLEHERAEYGKIETILERGKREWEATFDSVTDMIILTDSERCVIRCNRATIRYLDLAYNTIIGTPIQKLFFQDPPDNDQIFQSVLYETRFPTLKGWYEISTYPLLLRGEASGSVHVIKDITEQRQAQETLRKNQEELRQINDDLENRVWQRTIELIHANENLQHEVSEREKVQALLANERDLLSITLLSIRDGVISTDTQGTILLFNRAAETITGYRKEEVLGKPLGDALNLLDETSGKILPSPLKKLLDSQGEESHLQFLSLQNRQAEKLLISSSIAPVNDVTGDLMGYVMIITDITEEKRIEAQLALSQKMESIGRLAAGLSHEINTPLQYVGDNAHFLKEAFDAIIQTYGGHKDLVSDAEMNAENMMAYFAKITALRDDLDLAFFISEIPQAIQQSLEGIERVRKIVLAMKAFSHPANKGKKASDINQAIDTTVTISRNEWKYNADLEMHLDPNLPLVSCQIDEINQVLLNMIVNAAQAIEEKKAKGGPEKGLITISTQTKDEEVLIRIQDSGTGVRPENINRIFDPFFTTKEVGKGTGQGLALAHNIIVNQHKGRILVDSEYGKYTAFTICLPLGVSDFEQEPEPEDE